MKIRYFGWTDKGSVRSQNEDSMLLGSAVFNNTDSGGTSAVGAAEPGSAFISFAVADGMGGHKNGAIASGVGTRVVASHLVKKVYSLRQ